MEFSPSVAGAINTSTAEYGLDLAFMARVAELESSGNPSQITGSRRGLFQLSPDDWQKFGGGDIYNPLDNARAAARKFVTNRAELLRRFGRDPSPTELYLSHQQGMGGLVAHLTHPDAPAWRNMASTLEGRTRGERWAKQAVWGNIPDSMKLQFGDVNNVSGRQLIDLWRGKVEGAISPQVPLPRPLSAPRGSLDQPQNDVADSGALPVPSDLLGPPQPSPADGDGAFPAALSQMPMAPRQVPALSAFPTSGPIPPASQPLAPFFLPQGLNTGDSQAWPSAGAGDRSGTLDIYNSTVPPLPWLPSGRFGGAAMPDGPFASPEISGALSAGRAQTQVIPQQVSAPTPPMEGLLLDGTRQLLPFFFPQNFNSDGIGALPATARADVNVPWRPSSPSAPFGGGLMPSSPFAALPVDRPNGAVLAGPSPQTRTVPQQSPASGRESMEALLTPALRRLLPLLFASDGSPTDFGRGL